MIAALIAAALGISPASSAYADARGVPLRSPEAVACSDSGTVVVGDTGNGRLVVYRFAGGKLSGGDEVRAPEVGRPVRLQLDSRGNVLSLDGKGRRIARFGAGGAFAGFLEMRNVPAGQGFFPVSFKLDAQDAAWVLDAASERIVVVDAAGVFVREIALPRDGTVTDIALDGRGTVYAVDAVKGVLYVSSAGGPFKPLTSALRDYMNFAAYIAVTPQGPLVLVDQHGNGLVLLGRDGAFLGRRLAIGANDGAVYYPSQICVDRDGDVFVADRGNHRVQAFTAEK